MPEKQVLRRTINVIRYERLCCASTLVIWLSRRLFVSLIIVTRLSRASLLMSGDPAPHFNNTYTSWVDRKNIDDMLTNSIICWVCTSCCKSPYARIHLPYGLWCKKSSCSTQNPSPQMHKGFEEKRVGAKPVARSSCVACSRVFCTAQDSHFLRSIYDVTAPLSRFCCPLPMSKIPNDVPSIRITSNRYAFARLYQILDGAISKTHRTYWCPWCPLDLCPQRDESESRRTSCILVSCANHSTR